MAVSPDRRDQQHTEDRREQDGHDRLDRRDHDPQPNVSQLQRNVALILSQKSTDQWSLNYSPISQRFLISLNRFLKK